MSACTRTDGNCRSCGNDTLHVSVRWGSDKEPVEEALEDHASTDSERSYSNSGSQMRSTHDQPRARYRGDDGGGRRIDYHREAREREARETAQAAKSAFEAQAITLTAKFQTGLLETCIKSTCESVHLLAQDALFIGARCFGGNFENRPMTAPPTKESERRAQEAITNLFLTLVLPPVVKAYFGAMGDFTALQAKWGDLNAQQRAYELGKFVGNHILADQIAHKAVPKLMAQIDKIPTLIKSNI